MDLQLCQLRKLLLTMRPQKYVFDHYNQSMGLGANWKKNNLANFLQTKHLYVKRLESVVFSTEMYILQARTYQKVGPPGTEIKYLKFKTEIYQRIELKEQMRKMGVIRLVRFTPRVMVIKMSKMAHFMYSLLDTTKNQSQFGQDI